MIRMTLIAGTTLAAIASASPAAAQSGAPVRTLAPIHTEAPSTVPIAERKAVAKPIKRNTVAAAPSLGW